MIEENTKKVEHYQGNGPQNFHAPIHFENKPDIDEDDDKINTEFIGKYIECSLLNADQDPELHAVVKRVQTQHHKTIYRKKNQLSAHLTLHSLRP